MEGKCCRCGEPFPVEFEKQIPWFELSPATSPGPKMLLCGECVAILSKPGQMARRGL